MGQAAGVCQRNTIWGFRAKPLFKAAELHMQVAAIDSVKGSARLDTGLPATPAMSATGSCQKSCLNARLLYSFMLLLWVKLLLSEHCYCLPLEHRHLDIETDRMTYSVPWVCLGYNDWVPCSLPAIDTIYNCRAGLGSVLR